MLQHQRPGSSCRAFTLIEIMVVVIIMLLAASLALPYVISTGDMQVISAARILSADLQYAQNTAITAQSPITITFDISAESYTLSNASGPLNHPITKGAYIVEFASMDGFDKLDITAAGFGGTPIVTFDVLGAPDNAGSVTLQAGSHVYRINLAAATGQVSVAALGS